MTMAYMLKGVLLSDTCYDEYFNNLNFLDGPCFKATLSKGLGLGIILGSILVKVPQIVKILSSKSAKGINIISVLLELLAITANFAYSYVMKFPFSSWGESTFLGLQTAIIGALVLYYGGGTGKAVLFLTLYTALVAVLVSGVVPVHALWFITASNVPTMVVAKAIQINTNYQNSSTGQLSAITCLLLFSGSIARVFTSIQETGDELLILTFIISTITNGLVVIQLFWYWNVGTKTSKNKKKKKM